MYADRATSGLRLPLAQVSVLRLFSVCHSRRRFLVDKIHLVISRTRTLPFLKGKSAQRVECRRRLVTLGETGLKFWRQSVGFGRLGEGVTSSYNIIYHKVTV